MFFRKLSIILSITLLIFSSSIIPASALYTKNADLNGKEIVKDLGIIDNEMSLLINTISNKSPNKNDSQDHVKHIWTLINSLNRRSSQLPKEDKNVSIAINTILGFYQLSLISVEKYLKDFHSEDLISSISYFSTGYYTLNSIRNNIIYKAGK